MPGHSGVLWLRLWWNLRSSAGLFDARSEIRAAVFEIGDLVLKIPAVSLSIRFWLLS